MHSYRPLSLSLSLSHTVKHTYLSCSCKSCYYVLREPIKLRKLYEGVACLVSIQYLCLQLIYTAHIL
jgi:hypothetical protein